MKLMNLALSGVAVHIDRMGGFEEKAVRFYVAEIALALDYLHSIRIVHRCVPTSISSGHPPPVATC